MPAIFISGPVRSGKSRLAMRIAQQLSERVYYIATASLRDGDAEWDERIARHRQERPAAWQTVESAADPASLYETLRHADVRDCVIIDSLGTWLHAQMPHIDAAAYVSIERQLEAQAQVLLKAITACAATVVVVSEETGWGIVPAYPAGRMFRDVLGRLNQALARNAQRAYLVVSGYAIDIKIGVAVETWER